MNWTELAENQKKDFLMSIYNNKELTEQLFEESSDKCIYRPLRGKKTVCENKADYPYGYCDKHSSTLQATNAKQKWSELSETKPKNEEVKPAKETPEKEPAKESIKTEEKPASPKKSKTEVVKSKSPKKSDEPKKARIVRNKFGHYEHQETGIVFNAKTKQAYGVQHKNGDVYSLGPDQIKICIRNGWKYIVPQAKYVYESEDSSESDSSLDDSEHYESE